MKCSKQCMYAFNKATKVLGMIKRTIRFKDNNCNDESVQNSC